MTTSTAHTDPHPPWLVPYRHPWLLVFAALAATVVAALSATHVRVGNDLEQLLAGTGDYATYRRFVADFGSDEGILCFFRTEGLTARSLEDLYDFVTNLREFEGTEALTSIIDLVPAAARADRATFAAFVRRDSARERLAATIRRTRLARRRLCSDDERMFAVLVRLRLPSTGRPDTQRERRRLVEKFRAVVATAGSGRQVRLLGYPVVEDRVLTLVAADNRRLMPLSVAVGAAVLLLVFRRGWFLVAAMAAVLSALVWMVGTFPLRNYTLNAFSTMLVPLVLSIGLTTTVHVLAAYLNGVGVPLEAVVLPTVVPPCLLCTATTFIGFASLAVNDVSEVRNFGIFAALGTVFAFVAALVLIPSVLRLTGFDNRGPAAVMGRHRLDRWLGLLANEVVTHRRAVFVGGLVVLVACSIGLARLPVESSSMAGLYADDPLVVDSRAYERRFEPLVALEVLVRLPAGTTALSLDGFRLLRRLQVAFDGLPAVGTTLSAADLLLDTASYVAKTEKTDIPTVKECSLLQRFLRLQSVGPLVQAFVADDGRSARIHVTSTVDGSMALLDLAGRLQTEARRLLPSGAAVDVPGRNYVSAVTHATTLRNEFTCFLCSVVAILVVLVATFRSCSAGLLSAVPNVLPLAMTFATMGLLGVTFNVTTGMILCVTIGIVVDDTIHYMFRYRAFRSEGAHPRLAVRRATAQVGRPIVGTSVVLALGILVLTCSDFKMTAQFGAFTTLTIVYALLADLVLLPALLVSAPSVLAPSRPDSPPDA